MNVGGSIAGYAKKGGLDPSKRIPTREKKEPMKKSTLLEYNDILQTWNKNEKR